jgi:hypothetical protein
MSFVEQSNYATQAVPAENISPHVSETNTKTYSSFAEEKYRNFKVFVNQLTERNLTLATLVVGQLPSLTIFMILICTQPQFAEIIGECRVGNTEARDTLAKRLIQTNAMENNIDINVLTKEEITKLQRYICLFCELSVSD